MAGDAEVVGGEQGDYSGAAGVLAIRPRRPGTTSGTPAATRNKRGVHGLARAMAVPAGLKTAHNFGGPAMVIVSCGAYFSSAALAQAIASAPAR